MIYTYNEIKKIYYNHYMYNIYQLINKTNYSYNFLSIDEMQLYYDGSDFKKNNLFNDKFLSEFSLNKMELALDILQKGTYWPFFTCENNLIIEGSHRVYSLKLYDNFSKIHNKFLCINTPFTLTKFNNEKESLLNNIDLKQPVPFYKLDKDKLIKTETNNSYIIHQNIFKIGALFLNNAIFEINKKYKNFIIPNKILNNKYYFSDFLKQEGF